MTEEDLEILQECSLAMAQAVIQGAMNEAGIDRTALAYRLGVSRQSVSQMMSGDYNMTIKTMAKLLAACGFEVHFSLSKARTGHFRAIK